jgi:hypothetical protein
MEVLALAVILRLLFYAINYMLFWCSEIFFLSYCYVYVLV